MGTAKGLLARAAIVLATMLTLTLVSTVAVWACERHGDGPDEGSAFASEAARFVPAGQVDRTPPPGEMEGVDFIGNLPETAGAIAINFIEYGDERSVMFVTGEFGLKSYDVTDPEHPELLDSLDMPGLWENEDMDVDPSRKLVFLSRDPRAFGGNQATGESGVYLVSAIDPAHLRILSYVQVPAGHTTTCINDCKYLWTGGPMPSDTQPEDWAGRPIFVTDIRDPRQPSVYPDPIDLGRNDGRTDYAHDVQVDRAGIAWVSGQGGVRGYWTTGRHFDPVAERSRIATAADPVPYAGGKFVQQPDIGFPGGAFAHNSVRPVGAVGGFAPGEIAFVTIENFSSDCSTDGRLVAVSLGDSTGGQAWRSTPENPYRLDIVGEWTPSGKEGTVPGGCSAHYFQLRGNVITQSFYGNGTRFLDVSDPTSPKQIAYYRPDDASAWAPYWHDGVVYIADNNRGVDIIRPAYATASDA